MLENHQQHRSEMTEQFTLLTKQRRSMDLVLGDARRHLSRIEGTIRSLSSLPSSSSSLTPQEEQGDENQKVQNNKKSLVEEEEFAVTLLSAEVDCQRRALQSLCSLDDEKNIILQRQREEHDRKLRKLHTSFGCGDLGESLEELRQTEQRIRDLEDTLLADAANDDDYDSDYNNNENEQENSLAERRRMEEEEKLLRTAVRQVEDGISASEEKLRILSAKDADHMIKMNNESSSSSAASKHAHTSTEHEYSALATKKGSLKSKIAHKSTVVNRLAAAVDSIHPSSSAAALNNTKLFFSSKHHRQQHQQQDDNEEEDFLAQSLRSSPSETHRILSLVKAAVCHLRDDFDELSSTISRFSVDKSVMMGGDNSNTSSSSKKAQISAVSRWARNELQQVLNDISRLSMSALEEHFEDDSCGVSVFDLLKQIRRFIVLYDVLEPTLGKKVLFEELRLADDLNVLPQLYPISLAALEVKEELKKSNSIAAAAAAAASVSSSSSSALGFKL